MNDKDIDETIDNTVGSTKNGEHRSSKAKSKNETETPVKSSEKKKRAPVITITPDTDEPSKPKTRNHKVHESEDKTQAIAAADEEIPVKPKKKRAPKAETTNENTEKGITEEPFKKKKSKAPKPPPIDDEFEIIETPAIDELEPYIETKPKTKKKSKSKTPKKAISDSFEDLQVTNLDEMYSNEADIDVNTINDVRDTSLEDPPPPYPTENGTGGYEQAIMGAFNNLSSQVNFSQYVGSDEWGIVYLPKSGRTEPKSRIRKMLPGGGNDDKRLATKKPTQKAPLFNRLRTNFQTLLGDEKNMIFGLGPSHDEAYYDDDPDGVDTDDLHRYAQRLRELEDNDREVNPEYLVLRDGKTVFGVHEADTEGKVTLATRKPIYDRHADQKPDEKSDKKKLLSRLKRPFTRNKDEKNSKSAGGTPDPQFRRKSSRNSLNGDMTTAPINDPLID